LLATAPEVLHGCCAVQHVPPGGKAAVQQQDVRQRRHHCRLGVETWQTAAEPRAIALQQQGFTVRSLFLSVKSGDKHYCRQFMTNTKSVCCCRWKQRISRLHLHGRRRQRRAPIEGAAVVEGAALGPDSRHRLPQHNNLQFMHA